MSETPALDDEHPIPDIGATLRAALSTNSDVRDSARHRVDRALHARSAVSGYTSLLGCAVETLQHLLTNPRDPADRYTMVEALDPDPRRDDEVDDWGDDG